MRCGGSVGASNVSNELQNQQVDGGEEATGTLRELCLCGAGVQGGREARHIGDSVLALGETILMMQDRLRRTFEPRGFTIA